MFKKILWPTDFSKNSMKALPFIKLLSLAFKSKVYILHVVEELPEMYLTLVSDLNFYKKARERNLRDSWKKIERLEKRLRKAGMGVKTIVDEGSAYEKILKVSEELNPDLIVLSRRGLNPLESLILGSTSRRILHHAKKPVLMIAEPKRRPTIRKILVPTDLSEFSQRAYPLAAKLSQVFNAEIHLLHVLELFAYDPQKARRFLREKDVLYLNEKIQSKMKPPKGVEVKKHVIRRFEAAAAICEFALQKRMSLIVMASHGRTGLTKLLLGSVTDKVISISSIPVLVVKSE